MNYLSFLSVRPLPQVMRNDVGSRPRPPFTKASGCASGRLSTPDAPAHRLVRLRNLDAHSRGGRQGSISTASSWSILSRSERSLRPSIRSSERCCSKISRTTLLTMNTRSLIASVATGGLPERPGSRMSVPANEHCPHTHRHMVLVQVLTRQFVGS